LGITSASLAMQLRSAFWGNIAEEFQRGADTIEVNVRFDPRDRASLADLDDFKVRTPAGQQVPFHEVATAEPVRPFAQIVRVDRQRTVSVTADLDTTKGNAQEIVGELVDNHFPELHQRYPDVTLDLEGQSRETDKTFNSVRRGFLIGLVIIFILLSFVFKSYAEPLIVMTAIPFGMIGAIWGHVVTGLDLTMPSVIGFVSLSGIVVNDSIVLVSFVKLRLAEGMGVLEAVHRAGTARFRPVVLTSATTVAGLLPMMLERSLQAQFLIPMAVSIAFGLMFATAMVLLLVPCMYTILARLGLTQRIEVTRRGV
jgi:multidrug efflux pump subunit AcrB